MTVTPTKPVLMRLVEHVSIGTDLTGEAAVTVATGRYANVIQLMQACCTTASGITNVRLSDDFKFELYSTGGTTIDWDNSTLGLVLGFSSQTVLRAAEWVTADNRPRYVWIPKHQVADQEAFEPNYSSIIRGATSGNGTLAANQIGSLIYYRNARFVAEDNDNLSPQFCEDDEAEHRTLQTFVLGACTAAPSSSTTGNLRGFWWVPDINDAIELCTYQPHVDPWATAGDIDFDKTLNASKMVFCQFNESQQISQWSRSPFFDRSTLQYNPNLSFHTADIPTLASVIYEWSATFTALDYTPGVDNLPASITFPQGALTPVFRYFGGDADNTNWAGATYGPTLTLQAGTEPTYNTGSPFWGTNDDGVKFNDGGYYRSASNFTDVTTGDIYIEVLAWLNGTSTGNKYLVGTWVAEGFEVYESNDGIVRFLIDDGTQNIVIMHNGNVGCYVFTSAFVDRSEASSYGASGASNGTLIDSDDFSAQSGTLANGSYLAIGARPNDDNPLDSTHVLYTAMYTGSMWDGGSANETDFLAIHNERFERMCGIYPSLANVYTPTFTRAVEAYTENASITGNGNRYYLVGEGWPRVAQRPDSSDENQIGYLSERQSENLIEYSNDMENWTELDAGDTTTYQDSNFTAPDGLVETSTLVPDTDVNEHGWYTAVTLTADTYTFSVFAIKDQSTIIKLSAGSIGSAYFNIYTGTVVSQSGCTARISGYPYEFEKDGVGSVSGYRCSITFTGTAASHNMTINAYDDGEGGGLEFGGDGSDVYLVVWQAQCELGDHATTPIYTAGSTATRTKDVLTYVGNANIGGADVGEGEFDATIHLDDYNDTTGDRAVMGFSDGGSSADKVMASITVSDNVGAVSAASGGNAGSASSAVDVTDNDQHTITVEWETDALSVDVDDIPGTDDTSCDMPDGLDTIHVGADEGDDNQLDGLVSDIEIRGPS
jgi:hypothetical protein